MKWLKWEKGRQGTGYEKMFLLGARWPLKFDCYLVRFFEGQGIPAHVDPVVAGRHYRLNIILKSPIAGGAFLCNSPIYESARVKLFRPDQAEHEVTPVEKGSRYVFSLGWVRGA